MVQLLLNLLKPAAVRLLQVPWIT